MKSFRDRNPYAVGLVSLLVIGTATGLAFMVGLLHLLEDNYAMQGDFTDAAGLRVGDDVKVAGVDVGRVTGVEANRDAGLVRVEWVVDSGVDIRDGARAEIALETLLGSKYIRIDDADQVAALVADLPDNGRPLDGPPGEQGRVVPVERTSTPVDVFDLTREATTRIQATDNERLNLLIEQLAGITEGRRDSVTQLVRSIGDVSEALTAREGRLEALLDEVDELAGNLAEKDTTLAALIDTSRTLLDFLADRRDALARALGEGSDAVRSLSELIAQNEEQLGRILDDVHLVAERVEAHMPEINRALAIAGPAFYNQALAGSHGPWLDIYVAALGPDLLGILDGIIPELDELIPGLDLDDLLGGIVGGLGAAGGAP